MTWIILLAGSTLGGTIAALIIAVGRESTERRKRGGTIDLTGRYPRHRDPK